MSTDWNFIKHLALPSALQHLDVYRQEEQQELAAQGARLRRRPATRRTEQERSRLMEITGRQRALAQEVRICERSPHAYLTIELCNCGCGLVRYMAGEA